MPDGSTWPGPATVPQPFLLSRGSDALSVAVFAGVGVAMGAPLAPVPEAALAVGVTLIGPLATGIERGEARRLGWNGAAGLAGLACAAHLGTLLTLPGPLASPLELAARGLLVLVLGSLLVRFGARFDRGEEGWRAVLREGPPTGVSPLAFRIAALELPRPLQLLLLPLLPVALLLRGGCLLAILLYQLTLSRLMPSACRYEPTCSRYGFLAFRHFGCTRGFLLTALRLTRCSPLGSGGYDPIPPRLVEAELPSERPRALAPLPEDR